ncbi:MAG: hypothetical protein AAGI12_09070 [Pseudomonadota bacterium]
MKKHWKKPIAEKSERLPSVTRGQKITNSTSMETFVEGGFPLAGD